LPIPEQKEFWAREREVRTRLLTGLAPNGFGWKAWKKFLRGVGRQSSLS
jgi:hypothetical protein